MPETAPTTAEYLAAFYRELIESNLPDMLVHELVTNAGRRLLEDGVSVAPKSLGHV